MHDENFQPAVGDSVLRALELDLSHLTPVSGVLVQTARRIASEIDSGPSPREMAELSRELRQVVRQIREEAAANRAPSEIDQFIRSIQAEDFQ